MEMEEEKRKKKLGVDVGGNKKEVREKIGRRLGYR